MSDHPFKPGDLLFVMGRWGRSDTYIVRVDRVTRTQAIAGHHRFRASSWKDGEWTLRDGEISARIATPVDIMEVRTRIVQRKIAEVKIRTPEQLALAEQLIKACGHE